jgi:hypothetical protein
VRAPTRRAGVWARAARAQQQRSWRRRGHCSGVAPTTKARTKRTREACEHGAERERHALRLRAETQVPLREEHGQHWRRSVAGARRVSVTKKHGTTLPPKRGAPNQQAHRRSHARHIGAAPRHRCRKAPLAARHSAGAAATGTRHANRLTRVHFARPAPPLLRRAPVMDTSTAVTTKSHSARSVRRVFQKSRWNSMGAAVKPGRLSVQRALLPAAPSPWPEAAGAAIGGRRASAPCWAAAPPPWRLLLAALGLCCSACPHLTLAFWRGTPSRGRGVASAARAAAPGPAAASRYA